jgi:hypothetical protein
MSPRPTTRSRASRSRRLGLLVIAAAIAVVLAACGQGFDPTGPCTTDGAVAGAYPDLEAAVPKVFRGAPPKQLDSGRTCTQAGLATLAGHGITELRFAGGTWATGTDSGVSLAVFIAQGGPPLDPAWLAEFYEAGAREGKNVTSVDPSDVSIDGSVTGRRIDVLNGESFQSVVVWSRDGRVAVALVASFIREIQTREAHDKVVVEAINAFNG